MRRRPILYPFGVLVSEASRELCHALMHLCGGDLARVIDGPSTSLDAFARHIARIGPLRSGAEKPLVVLTRCHPLEIEVVRARHELEEALPSLVDAAWVVFVDPELDPGFVDAAHKMGTWTGRFAEAPIWTAANGSRYLIISPQTDTICLGEERIIDLERRGGRVTGPRPRDLREKDPVSAPPVSAPPQSGRVRRRASSPDAITEPPPAKQAGRKDGSE